MWPRIPIDTPNPRGPRAPARRGDRRRPSACLLSIEPLEARRVPTSSLGVGDATIIEGDSGDRYAEVVVTLSAKSKQTVTVNFATADETAIAGLDYRAASGRLSFAPGQRSKTILVPVIGDRIGEQDETFSVKLSGAKNARIDDGTGVVTIRDDDPHISIGDAQIVEGNSGKTLMTFTVSLSAAQAQAVTVDYATQEAGYYGAAYAGEDYVAKSGRLTFAPGETTKTISIEILGDAVPEPSKEVYVVLSNASTDVGISRGYAFGRIVDDDGWIDPGYYDGGYEGGSYS
jgi:hypothetical protein